jgi:hypothetical protein
VNHVADAPVEQASDPPLALFDVVAFAVLTLLALTEQSGALAGAVVTLAAARYILRW